MDHRPWSVYGTEDEIIFEPSEKQETFFNSRQKYILFGGARGGGKTSAALWKCIFTCLLVPGCNVCLIRKTYSQLETTVFPQFNNIPYTVYSERPEAYNKSSHVVRFDNGSHLYFRSCANVDAARQLFKGAEFVLIAIDEMTEFTYAEFEEMKGAMRSAHKVDIYGNPIVCQLVGLSNPGSIGHAWVKALFVDRHQIPGQNPDTYDASDYAFIKSLVTDNKVFAKDEDYIKSLDSLSPALKAAYRDGDWDIFAGQYFTNFDSDACVIDHDEVLYEMKRQTWQPKWISVDWGASEEHWAVALWHTTLKIKGEERQITYREMILNNIGEAAFANEVVRFNEEEDIQLIFIDPATSSKTGRSPLSIIGDVLAANNMKRPSLAINDRIPGWRLLYNMFEGRPKSKLQVSTNCPNLIKSIPMLIRHTPEKPEDVKKITAMSDDIADCWRYGIYSYMRGNEKPKDIEIREKLQAIDDPTRRNIVWLQLKNKNKRKAPLRSR
jgi:phage terminase large subunit